MDDSTMQSEKSHFSAVVVAYPPKTHASADVLIKEADLKMYENKRKRKKSMAKTENTK